MRKLIIGSLMSVMSVACFSMAMTTPSNNVQTQASHTASDAMPNNVEARIKLYQQPQAGQVIAQLPVNIRLVPIYQQGKWVKVGDPRNGQVGWVDLAQYRKAREQFLRPDIQTVYIQINKNEKDGKPTLNIVAYKNGKQLSQAQANELYKQMRDQQQASWRNMRHFFWQADRDLFQARRMFNPLRDEMAWGAPYIIMPLPQPRMWQQLPENNDAAKEMTKNEQQLIGDKSQSEPEKG